MDGDAPLVACLTILGGEAPLLPASPPPAAAAVTVVTLFFAPVGGGELLLTAPYHDVLWKLAHVGDDVAPAPLLEVDVPLEVVLAVAARVVVASPREEWPPSPTVTGVEVLAMLLPIPPPEEGSTPGGPVLRRRGR